uniref:CCHC-type domain-containing protein n=1 Tax=Aegilops tauschii subsp. strangulata TaxID=200361 RepID=A0A453APD9_AEGTS
PLPCLALRAGGHHSAVPRSGGGAHPRLVAMASRVSLSGSLSSGSGFSSSAPPANLALPSPLQPPPRPDLAPSSLMRPRPLIRSIIVPPVLGTAFGPIVQGETGGPSRVPVPRRAEDAWHTKVRRRPRAPPCRDRLPRRRLPPSRPRVLSAPRPPPFSRLPVELHGCCYNCGSDGHISADCSNPPFCVRCRGVGHISRGCTRPRSPSPVDQPVQPPALRRRVEDAAPPSPRHSATSQSLPPPPPGPPPLGVVRLWSDVVREPAQGSLQAAGATAGPEFSVPFGQHAPVRPAAVRAQAEQEDLVEACFLEASEDIWQMEAELARAVLVTVTGNRPTVDLASATEALHAAFDIGPADMSIRSYFPDDFLVLCRDGAIRNRMVRAGHAHSSWFELNLRPWNRQAHATAASLPFLVPIALRGV